MWLFIPAETLHWHGALDNSDDDELSDPFSHLAMGKRTDIETINGSICKNYKP